jgi:hypothetical protein
MSEELRFHLKDACLAGFDYEEIKITAECNGETLENTFNQLIEIKVNDARLLFDLFKEEIQK